ncbi:MAG TPA: FAD-dependent oxidoreductase, partial [Solirubrobacterales bacterium]
MKVIVLGGGVAGMSAAHELAERDVEVVVYEARTIPGGKARSLPVTGSGKRGRSDLPAEHGFRFFPG